MLEQEQTEYHSSLPIPEQPIASPPSPDNPPWSSGIAFGVWAFSVLLILFVPAVFVLPYIAAAGPSIQDAEAFTQFATKDRMAILLQIIAIIPAHVLTLVAAYYVVTRYKKYSFTEMLGWSNGGFRWWVHPLIVIGFLILAGGLTVVVPEQEHEMMRILKSSREAVFVVAIMATFTAPLVEEVIYRGVLYSAFQRSVGVPAAFCLVTLLFAFVHVPQYYPSVATIVLLSLLSVTLTAMRVFSRNLWPCIVLHTVFNATQSLMLILEPWMPQIETTAPDPAVILNLLQ